MNQRRKSGRRKKDGPTYESFTRQLAIYGFKVAKPSRDKLWRFYVHPTACVNATDGFRRGADIAELKNIKPGTQPRRRCRVVHGSKMTETPRRDTTSPTTMQPDFLDVVMSDVGEEDEAPAISLRHKNSPDSETRDEPRNSLLLFSPFGQDSAGSPQARRSSRIYYPSPTKADLENRVDSIENILLGIDSKLDYIINHIETDERSWKEGPESCDVGNPPRDFPLQRQRLSVTSLLNPTPESVPLLLAPGTNSADSECETRPDYLQSRY